jgi:hypothetical protein
VIAPSDGKCDPSASLPVFHVADGVSCCGQRECSVEQRCDLVFLDEGIQFEEYARVFLYDERAELLPDER